MWYKIYFKGKFIILVIVNEMIYLYYFNIVIQSLRYLGKYVLCYNRQNKATKIDGAVVCLSFAVNMARFGNITADKSTYFFSFYLQNEVLCIRLAFPLYRPTVLIELEKRGNCDRCIKKKKEKGCKNYSKFLRDNFTALGCKGEQKIKQDLSRYYEK